jgi:chemotaxis protein methyltransferase CheR
MLNEIILPDHITQWQEHRQAAHARHETGEIQFRIRAKNGRIRWIEHICQPIHGDKGEYLGIRASNRDITARKQTEIMLRSAYTEIEQLKNRLEAESAYLQDEIKLEHNFENIIGNSDALKYVLYRVAEVASTDTHVLILGETGTGKELIARAIHNLSSRSKRALVKVNCAALPASVIESELFGHEKGAFTGAGVRRVGRFQLADGTTLFLDEISEIPLELQPKLLQVLQDGEFEPLGSSKTLRVDMRIIAASNRDLEDEVNHSRFRRDLFYRINVFPLTVPPLRNRKDDIPLLVKWFVDRFNRKMNKNITSIPKALIKHLQAYDWPGNVRELENVVERAMIASKGSKLKLTDNFVTSAKVRSRAKLKETLTEVERAQILNTLEKTGWKIEGANGAAGVLGLAPSTLRDRIKKLGISNPMK